LSSRDERKTWRTGTFVRVLLTIIACHTDFSPSNVISCEGSVEVGHNSGMARTRSSFTSPQRVPYALFSIIAGAIGLFASFELLTEYIKTLVEPDYAPNCNISVLVTCGPN